jgi:TP901 family phage tail tape measure protein
VAGGPIKGLTVEVGGETKGLQAALKDVGRVSNDINKELGQIEKGLKFDPQNSVLLAQKHELLEKKIVATRDSLDALRQAEERVEKMFKSGEIDAGQYREFRRQIEASESKLKTFEKQVKDVEKAQKDAGKTASEWGKKLKDGSEKAALGAGAAAGAAFTAGFLGGMDVEKASDKLVAQLGASGKDAERYGEVAANLYAGAWGDSMEDVTGAVGAVVTSIGGMREASDSELEDITAKVLDFATAFEVDVPRAAQVAGQMVKAGLADDATGALDLLTRSMQNVPAAVRDDIMDAVDEYGPFLASIGIDGPQAFGLLVKGAERGMYGIDKTGDALKEFTIRATDMSKGTKEAYDILGLSMPEMTRKLLKGGETGAKAFDQIVAALLDVGDPIRQSQAALALFGTPLEDLSVQEIPAFLKGLDDAKGALGDVDGAVSDMGQTLNDNAATSLESFKRQVQKALVDKMEDALPAMQGVFEFLSQYSGVIVPLVGALAGFAGVIAAISAAMKAWAIIQAVLNATMWASPITWIVAAVIALAAVAYLVIKNWEPISAFFEDLWETIKNAFGAAKDWIVEKMGALKDGALEKLDALVAFVTGLPEAILSALGDLGSLLLDAGKALLQGLLTGATWVWDNLVAPYLNLHLKILKAVGSLVSVLLNAGKDVLRGLLSGLKWLWDMEVKGWLNLGAKIKSAVGSLGSVLYDAGKAVMKGLYNGLKWAWDHTVAPFLDKVTRLIPDWKGPIEDDRRLLIPAGEAIMGGLMTGMQGQLGQLRQTAAQVSATIAGAIAPRANYSVSAGQLPTVAGGGAAAAVLRPGDVFNFYGDIVAPDPSRFIKAIEREVALQGRARGMR